SVCESSDTLIVVQLRIQPCGYHPAAACRDEADTVSAPPIVVWRASRSTVDKVVSRIAVFLKRACSTRASSSSVDRASRARVTTCTLPCVNRSSERTSATNSWRSTSVSIRISCAICCTLASAMPYTFYAFYALFSHHCTYHTMLQQTVGSLSPYSNTRF